MSNLSILDGMERAVDEIDRLNETNQATFEEKRVTSLRMAPYKFAKDIQKTNPHALNANSLLKRQIFKDGLVFYRGKNQVEPSDEFDQIIKKDLIPFLQEVMDMIHTLGICPYLYVKKEEGRIIPVVPTGDFDIAIVQSTKDYTKEYKFIPKKAFGGKFMSGADLDKHADKRVRFVSGLGFDPTDKGIISSPMVSTIHSHTLVTTMFNLSLEAEDVRTNPPILTESISQNADGPNYGHGEFGEAIETEDRVENQYKRTYEDFQLAQYSRRLYNEHYLSGPNGSSKKMKTGEIREKGVTQNIPFGRKYVRPQMPESRNDIIQLDNMLQQIFFGVYGVPRNMVYEAIHGRIKNDPNIENFRTTVRSWKQILSELATQWYNDAYGDEELKKSLVKKASKEKKPVFFMSHDDILETKESTRITIEFPSVSVEDEDMLFRKYTTNVLTWEEYWETNRRTSGLPMISKTPKELFNDKEKKEMAVALRIGAPKGDDQKKKSSDEQSTNPDKSSIESDESSKKRKRDDDDE